MWIIFSWSEYAVRVCCEGNRKLEQTCKHLDVAVTTVLSEPDNIFIPKRRARTAIKLFLQSQLALAREKVKWVRCCRSRQKEVNQLAPVVAKQFDWPVLNLTSFGTITFQGFWFAFFFKRPDGFWLIFFFNENLQTTTLHRQSVYAAQKALNASMTLARVNYVAAHLHIFTDTTEWWPVPVEQPLISFEFYVWTE